ncbi:MAG TPA: hypothetical protein VHF69_08060, partial [Candidatus Synoicihabitans sp.]|nr:hypothetical protein [Candidatus Synoicihabitans sp.]
TAAQIHNSGKARLDAVVEDAQDRLDNETTRLVAVERGISDIEEKIRKLNEQVAEAREHRKAIITAQTAAESALLEAKNKAAAFVPRDEAPLRAKLAESAQKNQQVMANRTRSAALALVEQKAVAADALTAEIEAIDAQKANQLAEVKFPIDGLSFTEDGVTYNGLPFDQASSAEQLRVSVAIAAASNPKLGVMLVRDGSLMDDKSMTLLAELAQQHDVQVWVERVSQGSECSVIIEDGAVLQVESSDAS